MIFVRLALEGKTDVPVAERVLNFAGVRPFEPIVAESKTRLDPMVPGLNRAAAGMNWLILRDLDHDAPCPADLVDRLLKGKRLAPRMSLRIAVRATESWLLADAEAFAAEFSVSDKHVPASPDDCRHPSRPSSMLVASPGGERSAAR